MNAENRRNRQNSAPKAKQSGSKLEQYRNRTANAVGVSENGVSAGVKNNNNIEHNLKSSQNSDRSQNSQENSQSYAKRTPKNNRKDTKKTRNTGGGFSQGRHRPEDFYQDESRGNDREVIVSRADKRVGKFLQNFLYTPPAFVHPFFAFLGLLVFWLTAYSQKRRFYRSKFI